MRDWCTPATVFRRPRGAEILEERRQAELARTAGRIDVQTWKEEANAVRLSIYASLLSLAAQTGRTKAWADVFLQQKSARLSADTGDEPADGGKNPRAPDHPPGSSRDVPG